MPRAGYCSACQANVWLTDAGGCVNGHGPEYISSVYESDPSHPAQQPTTPIEGQPRSKTGLIIAIVVGALLVMCGCPALFVVGGVGVPVFNAAKGEAQQRTCWANQRTIEGAAQMWLAENPDSQIESLDGQAWIAELVDATSYIKAPPVCPSGNPYFLSSGQVDACPEHGYYEESGDM